MMYFFNGTTENTARSNAAELQKLIDDAAVSGGTVIVNGGRYEIATVFLRSNVSLYLENGATLVGSTDIKDYGHCSLKPRFGTDVGNVMTEWYYALIVAENCENVLISGGGTIDGRGKYKEFFPNKDDPKKNRPFLLNFYNCKGVTVKDVTLKDSGMYAFFSITCENVLISGVKIRTRDSGNGDGLDFDGGKNVRISDCDIDAGDDAISPKSFMNAPIQNFVVSNCVLKSKWAAIRFGVESASDMRDIAVSNCVFRECGDGVKMQCCGAGVYENITFDNIVMRDVLRPFFITLNNFRMSSEEPSVITENGKIRNVSFSNILISSPRKDFKIHNEWLDEYNARAIVVSGVPHNKIENITFTNVTLEAAGGGEKRETFAVPEFADVFEQYPEVIHLEGESPVCGFFVRHVDGLKVRNCNFSVSNSDVRPFSYFQDVNGDMKDCELRGVTSGFAIVNGGNFSVCDCRMNGERTGATIPDEQIENEVKRVGNAYEEYFAYVRKLAGSIDKTLSVIPEAVVSGGEIKCENGVYKLKSPVEGMYTFVASKVCGDCVISVNGKIAASHKAADLYDICYNIPVNVTLKKDDEIEIAFKNAEGFGGHRGTGNARIPHGIRGTISFYKSENL